MKRTVVINMLKHYFCLKNSKNVKQKHFERFPYGVHESFLSLVGLSLILPLPKKVKHEKDEYKNIPSKRSTTGPIKGRYPAS